MTEPTAIDLTGFAHVEYMMGDESHMDITINTDNDKILDIIRGGHEYLIQDIPSQMKGIPNGISAVFTADDYISHITQRYHRVRGKLKQAYYRELPTHIPRIPVRDFLSIGTYFFKLFVPPHCRKTPLKRRFKLRVRKPFAANMREGDIVRWGDRNRYILQIKKIEPVRKQHGEHSENWVWLHCKPPMWQNMV